MDDDTTDAAYHQLELEDRRAWEEYVREYQHWIDQQGYWWQMLDEDIEWQKEFN